MSDLSTSAVAPRAGVPVPHLLLALAIVAIWGTNFAIMKVALVQFPPLAFGALRFVFCLVPGIFFLKRPAVAWRWLAAYGLLIGVGQFGLVYIAVSGFISPGLASLIIQLQVFFTILMSARAGEKVAPLQWLALAVAFVGLGVIAAHVDAQTTVVGLVLMLIAAVSWAAGNMVIKRSPGVDMLAYMVWSSLFCVPPLIVLSLVMDHPAAVGAALVHADWKGWAAVLWQAVGNTLFGFAAWGWLLNRHKASAIAPMALLVPVFGLGASAIWLNEALPVWKLTAAGLVVAGLLLNMLAGRRGRKASDAAPLGERSRSD